MSKIRLEFFAMREEQHNWIEQLLLDDRVWCVLDHFPPHRKIELVTGTEFLSGITFSKLDERGGMRLFFGHRDLVPSPIWRTTGAGFRELDLIYSQAIQYSPSMVVGDNILLKGQMAIMRPIQYEEAGIDPKPVLKWFRQVAKSFLQLTMPGGVIGRGSKTGATFDYPEIRPTHGAAAWRRTGRLLKQLLKGAVEYDIRTTNDNCESSDTDNGSKMCQ